MRHRCGSVGSASGSDPTPAAKPGVVQAKITSLGQAGDSEARCLLRRALRDAEPAAQRFGWRLLSLYELPADDDDVGYTAKDGTIFVKVRDPAGTTGSRLPSLYTYSFVLATLLHELVHLSYLGHGKTFYRCLSAALTSCAAEGYILREARAHVCAELLNAVCDNDARRARALLAAMPEAAMCRRPGAVSNQLPLEYAAHHGRVALTKLLLEARADPTVCSTASSGTSVGPLERATANGNSKTAALLLAAAEGKGGARANVAECPAAKSKSVLDKAIAAAEGKGSEWWKVAKVLSDNPPPPPFDAAAPPRRSGSQHRHAASGARHAVDCGASDAGGRCQCRARRALSMPSLPAVTKLPALAGLQVRRPLAVSTLAGSLAL